MKEKLNRKSAFVTRTLTTAILFCLLFLISCAGTKPVAGNTGQDTVSPEVHAAFYAIRAAQYVKNGDFNNAIIDLKKCVSVAPASEKTDYENLLGLAYGTRGIFYYKNGSYDNAISDLTKTVQLVSASKKTVYEKLLGKSYGDRGAYKGMNGYIDGGISDIKTCLRYIQDNKDRIKYKQALGILYVAKGDILSFQGDKDGAKENYLKAVLYNLSAISN
ncbi:hypothetical protein QUF70_04835 [Desulfobacterales bacterium HSG17]|nr:hypothetical protein [Desulfobacterales bacterium HSG17]